MAGAQQDHAVRQVYRYKALQRDFCLVLGIVFGVSGCGLAAAEVLQHSDDLIVFLILSGIFLALGGYLLASAFRSTLVIDGKRIGVRGPFSARIVSLADVEGFRTISASHGWQLILKSGGGMFHIPASFETDDAFTAWLNQVPDLDALDNDTLRARVEEEHEVGVRLSDWLQKLARAHRRSWGLFLIALCCAISLNIAPAEWYAPFVAVLILAPFVATYLCWLSPALYSVFKKRSDPRAETCYVLIAATVGLMLRLRGLQLASVRPLAIFMILAGLGLASASYQTAKKGASRSAFVAVLLFAGLFGFSSVMAADIFFDNGRVMRYSADVVGTRVSSSFPTTYYLRVSPWGPVTEESEVKVSSSIYLATHTGDLFCFDGSKGRFGAPWFRIAACNDPGL